MSDHHIQLVMLIVQALALAGLIWYAIETKRMRQAAQEQIRLSQRQVVISQGLIDAAMDQVEGLSKPCLILCSTLRDQADAILSMDGAVGNTIALGTGGRFVLQNIGNGVALNVSYRFNNMGEHVEPRNRHKIRYMPNVLTDQQVTMVEGLNSYRDDHEVVFWYESIGGRKYLTRMKMSSHVLTELKFAPFT